MTKEELQRDLDMERGMYQALRKKHEEMEATLKIKDMELKKIFTKSDIIKQVEENIILGIRTATFNALSDTYNSPVKMIVNDLIAEKKNEITELMRAGFDDAIKSGDIRTALKTEMSRKIAQLLLQNVSGSIEKAINECRQDATFKAKVIMRVDELLSNKGEEVK